jgi:hypothetical protein
MKKKTNIIYFLRLRALGKIMPFFKDKIVVLSRPHFDDWDY